MTESCTNGGGTAHNPTLRSHVTENVVRVLGAWPSQDQHVVSWAGCGLILRHLQRTSQLQHTCDAYGSLAGAGPCA